MLDNSRLTMTMTQKLSRQQ